MKEPVKRIRKLPAWAGPTPVAGQRGVALIVGLIILVVLAMLGVSAYSVATQDERLAGNARDHARALEAAETMLRACERYIEQNAPVFDGVTAPGYFLPAPTTGTWFAFNSYASPWTSAYAIPFSFVQTWPGNPQPEWIKNPPLCIAEAAPSPAQPPNSPAQAATLKIAHVAAQGYGLSSSTVVTLESYVAYY